MKKIFDALVDGSVALISRFLPDAYILVLLLTVILFVVAVPVTGIAPAEGITVADRLVNLVYDGWYGANTVSRNGIPVVLHTPSNVQPPATLSAIVPDIPTRQNAFPT